MGEIDSYEFCPRCEANLTLQKGYQNTLPYWICKGCGEMLINPEVPGEIAWICDQCETMLNVQEGFDEACGIWTCTKCGHQNRIDSRELYLSDDEYRAALTDVYKGLTDQEVLTLSMYTEIGQINGRDDILLVKDEVDGKLYVKKILHTYDASVFQYLLKHPIAHMPAISYVFEGTNNLIVLESYIKGNTLAKVLESGPIPPKKAIAMMQELVWIVRELHSQSIPIIHRDIKPSNIMLDANGTVFLLDMNVAKWYKPDETEDTRLLGTQYYAAPEQLGFGFSASSEKTDIYSLGILFNQLLTGKFPKEAKAPMPFWHIIEKCICLEPQKRYTDEELLLELEHQKQ